MWFRMSQMPRGSPAPHQSRSWCCSCHLWCHAPSPSWRPSWNGFVDQDDLACEKLQSSLGDFLLLTGTVCQIAWTAYSRAQRKGCRLSLPLLFPRSFYCIKKLPWDRIDTAKPPLGILFAWHFQIALTSTNLGMIWNFKGKNCTLPQESISSLSLCFVIQVCAKKKCN